MAMLMAGAILLCSASALAVAFIPFFSALIVSVVLGAAVALVRGGSVGDLLSPCFVLLVTGQLAYGLGLFGQFALSRLKRRKTPDAWRTSARSSTKRGRRVDKIVDPVRNRLG